MEAPASRRRGARGTRRTHRSDTYQDMTSVLILNRMGIR